MKQIFILLIALLMLFACEPTEPTSYASYDEYPIYDGSDLGLYYTPLKSVFKIWSPTAQEVKIHLYEAGEGGKPTQSKNLKRSKNGVWEITFKEDLKGKFYTFQVKVEDNWLAEVPDPYAKAVGVNGNRGMVLDFSETNPDGWENDKRPPLTNFNDIIIYELHVRDLSSDPNAGIKNAGKFLGLTELATKSKEGEMTGLDHIKDLGITHIHLLPSFDFKSLDESIANNPKYNWGYDPKNYNVPEGSYATNPYDGAVRIREFKEMVKTLHDNGIRIILDVVYNHTGDTEASIFNQIVPGYYYRHNEDGSFSDAAACGNETASERPMMRKFIIESVKYWVNEYHIDGFRFDLMAIHDQETMNQISAELHKIDPTIFIYGEGWTAGNSPLPEEHRALKKFTYKLDKIAAFSDDMRDGIKGHVFTPTEKAFISGKPGLEESIKFGIVASTQHPQVLYDSVNYSKEPWAKEPYQTIIYVSCHDNHTLWDRLAISAKEASEAERIKMHKLAGAMVLTSQGVSFLHAGIELLRTKQGVENSFESPDSINLIDWSRKSKYKDVYNYYKDLITLRKNHPAFRMTSTEQIQKNLKFLEFKHPNNIVGYTISNNANGDTWKEIIVFYNGNRNPRELYLPEGEWSVVLDDQEINESGIRKVKGGEDFPIMMSAISALVLVR
ncbi:MAG: type I pullulanase [Saprospiraceae bacterium]|nr:type I pullulanase [Saprospiraceae bacterium]